MARGWKLGNPWTDELTKALRVLWDGGYSSSSIARQLGQGLTRNAVIGKARRLKLSMRRQNPLFRPKGLPQMRAPKPPPPPKPDLAEPAPLLLGGAPVTLLNAGFSHCRWPIWSETEREHFRVCGHQKIDGSPYCAFHAKRSAGSGTASERAATKAPAFKTWETA